MKAVWEMQAGKDHFQLWGSEKASWKRWALKEERILAGAVQQPALQTVGREAKASAPGARGCYVAGAEALPGGGGRRGVRAGLGQERPRSAALGVGRGSSEGRSPGSGAGGRG